MYVDELQKTIAIARADYALCRQTPLQCMLTIAEAFALFAARWTKFHGAVLELQEVVVSWQKLQIPATEAMERINRIVL